MITLFVEENNPISPNFYNNVINNLQFHQLECPCGHAGCLTIHGYYYRYIKVSFEKLRFRICRVKCSFCNHTHALLLSSMVPHSQISLYDQFSIIHNYEKSVSQKSIMDENIAIDESAYRYIIRQYLRHWKQKLLSERISFDSISILIKSCFTFFSYQFMQIKKGSNILFLNTT